MVVSRYTLRYPLFCVHIVASCTGVGAGDGGRVGRVVVFFFFVFFLPFKHPPETFLSQHSFSWCFSTIMLDTRQMDSVLGLPTWFVEQKKSS